MSSTRVTWAHVRQATLNLIERTPVAKYDFVYGIPTGGSFVAQLIAELTPLEQVTDPPGYQNPSSECLIVDDIVDSGKTLLPWFSLGFGTDALYRKPIAPPGLAPDAAPVTDWIQFPWEHEIGPEDAVTRLIEYIGDNPKREGLRDTPARVVRSLREMCEGYAEKPQDILHQQFNETCDEMIVETGIRFSSLCEHHMLPFVGTCTVGYVPKEGVIGASKLARLVHCFAKRLQIQERMTIQIANALMDSSAAPLGVGVVVKAAHSCMGCRGVVQPTAEFITSSLLGVMRDDAMARAEFLALAR